ncbi:MAG: sigma-70 family RNA polymerase sigma factor [Salinivirgaceae bacterium]|jgi:DNA-directed RNA polymerase specialized sigma24 family protein|nr:sigma-70 family RNA polymerase sigma factor [Salinivirgaceae bacterium]
MSRLPGADKIAEILNGNEKVISTVYKKVYRHLENYGRSINASDHNIKESVQDAFEVFYRQILNKKLVLSCTLETYIISIAKRALQTNERNFGSYTKEPINAYELIDEKEFSQVIEDQKHKLFVKEFKKLNEECRRVITLTLEGFNATQIKKRMNYSSESFVRIKRQRCKSYLTQKIKENPEYEKLRNANPEDFEFPL